jgi:hypothetical protein
MSDVTYALKLYNSAGTLLDTYVDLFDLGVARSGNEPPALSVRLPSGVIAAANLVPDARLELVRTGTDGTARRVFGTMFLLTGWSSGYSGNEADLTLSARGAASLLERRIVKYVAGSAEASKTDYADDMMRDIVRENFGSGAGSGRDWSAYLTVEADTSLAPSVSKSFAWRNVRAVLDDLCEASAQNASPIRLFYDIPHESGTGFVFRIYTGQRGTDRRLMMTLDSAAGDVQDARLARDYAEEKTYAIVGGQGEGAGRTLVYVEDTTRYDGSPFARKEVFVDARNYTSSTGMSDEGAAALYDARRLVTFAGKINTGAYEYGRDWEFGDRLYVSHEGVRVDCIVHSVAIRLSGGREDVVAELRSL